jgi:REP element-mobilizing transposase RayT
MEKYRNKYRIPSARLQNWDYGTNGAYFITICTAHRRHYFGEIVQKRLIASETGILAQQYWMEIPDHFPFIELGNFVVMPNHVHGILIVDKKITVSTDVPTVSPMPPTNGSTPPPTNKTGGFAGNKNPMIQENISRIIRWYKGRCSFEMRKINIGFGWQTRFHDHIIRNHAEYERIDQYITNNPAKWDDDTFYIE